MFASAYGWTIHEIDDLTVGQMLALLEEIKGSPPVNIVASMQRKAEMKAVDDGKRKQFEDSIGKMQDFVEGSAENKETKIQSKRGKVLGVMNKKTGKILQGVKHHE